MDAQEATKNPKQAFLAAIDEYFGAYIGFLQPKTLPEKLDGLERMKSLVANLI